MHIPTVGLGERHGLRKRRPAGNACRHSTHLYCEVQKFRPLEMQSQRAICEMKITTVAHGELKLWAWRHARVLLDNPIWIISHVKEALHVFGDVVMETRTHSDGDQVRG